MPLKEEQRDIAGHQQLGSGRTTLPAVPVSGWVRGRAEARPDQVATGTDQAAADRAAELQQDVRRSPSWRSRSQPAIGAETDVPTASVSTRPGGVAATFGVRHLP